MYQCVAHQSSLVQLSVVTSPSTQSTQNAGRLSEVFNMGNEL